MPRANMTKAELLELLRRCLPEVTLALALYKTGLYADSPEKAAQASELLALVNLAIEEGKDNAEARE